MKTIIRIFVLSTLLLSSLAVTAQEELANPYRSPDDSFAFNYPQDWLISEQPDEAFIRLGSTEAALEEDAILDDSVLLTFYPPAALADLEADTPAALLEAYLETQEMTTDDTITDLSIEEREAATVQMDSDSPGMLVAIPFQDETIGLVIISTEAELTDYMDTLLAIMATFDNYDEAIHGAETQEKCVVSVDTAGIAALRVGPGINRTELSSLQPDVEVTVLGKSEADDGSRWWQLDKQEALPQSAAAEIWVAQDQVVATGACEQIGDADAPPLIPISSDSDTAAAGEAVSSAGVYIQILIPRSSSTVITNRTQTAFEAMAYAPAVGQQNGAGIIDIRFEILDANGNQLRSREESHVRYCAFGGDDQCDPMPASFYDSLADGKYTIRARARNKQTNEWSNWVSRTFCKGSCLN